MTEFTIQRDLFRYLLDKGHSLIAPNCNALCHEADILSLTRAGYAWEFEIKITRKDFLADKKKRKHKLFKNPALVWHNRLDKFMPARFFYVAPSGLIEPKDLPSYAGLLEHNGQPITRCFDETVKALQFHKQKAAPEVREAMATSLMWRTFNCSSCKE